MLSTITLVNAFLLGLVASFSPCLFPVLPAFVAHLSNKEKSQINGPLAGILTTLGIMTVFVTISLSLNSIGEELIEFIDGRRYLIFQFWEGVLLVIFGVLIAFNRNIGGGKFEKLSDKIQNYILRFDNPLVLSFLIGLFFAILAAPCALVVFGTFLNLILVNPGFGNALTLSLLFSVGAGIPFLVMGVLVPNLRQELVAKSEIFIKWIPILTGLIILIVGLSLMYFSIESGYPFEL